MKLVFLAQKHIFWQRFEEQILNGKGGTPSPHNRRFVALYLTKRGDPKGIQNWASNGEIYEVLILFGDYIPFITILSQSLRYHNDFFANKTFKIQSSDTVLL